MSPLRDNVTVKWCRRNRWRGRDWGHCDDVVSLWVKFVASTLRWEARVRAVQLFELTEFRYNVPIGDVLPSQSLSTYLVWLNAAFLSGIADLRTLMWPIVTDRVAWSVGRSVCHTTEPYKTVQPIEMPFGLRTRVGPRNLVLDGGLYFPKGRAIFRGEGPPIVK